MPSTLGQHPALELDPARRLSDKVAIVVGAGQTPGETIGNGRATAILFARHGAKLLLADRDLESAEQTKTLIEQEGGSARTIQMDITVEADCERLARTCIEHYGRIDVLHNNVGIGHGDAGPVHIELERFERIWRVNLVGPLLTCKYVLPVMREQRHGAIVNVSSIASIAASGLAGYKTSKAGLNALTHSLATGNAQYGIRVNAILPGLMNTPMAVENISQARGINREQLIAARDRQVPLGGKMGTGWDVAYAALFLASEEARFITGVLLKVDGGQSARIG
jgi:NAD(P)-dependent dehydrogenase (short-subunit alcohol dehydrogenase family)